MKILFTGATGVLGKASVPLLAREGHDIHGVARTTAEQEWLDSVGARPVEVDLFDSESLSHAMSGIDTVIHFATSIPPQDKMQQRSAWAMNDRLRADATSLLVDVAIANEVERFVQQSVGFVYADGGDEWLEENSPIEPVWDVLDSALVAESHVRRFGESGGTAIALRLGRLYGPGASSAEFIDGVRRRRLPIVGSGENWVSSIHSHDAATALMASLEAPSGTYNIADHFPMRSKDNLGALAEVLGVRRPRKVPVWLAKRILGDATKMLTVSHRLDNTRFHTETGWEPKFVSAVEGWADVVVRSQAD